MPPWIPVKPLAAIGVLGAAAGLWVLVFRSDWSNAEWDNASNASTAVRGKTVYIGNKEVETATEKEKRLAIQNKALREEVGTMVPGSIDDPDVGESQVPEDPL